MNQPGPHLSKSRAGGWSTNGPLAAGGDPSARVEAQGDLNRACAYIVSFAISEPPPGAIWIRFCEALIEWSVNGNSVSRRVSVTNGMSVTGTGEAVKVTIVDKSIHDPAVPAPPPEPYNVTVQWAPGTRGGSVQPPVLQPAITPASFIIAAAGVLVIPVPQDAGVIAVEATAWVPAGGGAIVEGTVSVSHEVGALILKRYDPRGQGTGSGWVPLAMGATSVTLHNDTGANVQFSLVFGIDG